MQSCSCWNWINGQIQIFCNFPKMATLYVNMMSAFPDDYYLLKPFFPYAGHYLKTWSDPQNTWVPYGLYGEDPELFSNTYNTAYKSCDNYPGSVKYKGYNNCYCMQENWINKNPYPHLFIGAKVPVAGASSIQQQFITLDFRVKYFMKYYHKSQRGLDKHFVNHNKYNKLDNSFKDQYFCYKNWRAPVEVGDGCSDPTILWPHVKCRKD